MTKEEIKKQIKASIRLYNEGYILNYGEGEEYPVSIERIAGTEKTPSKDYDYDKEMKIPRFIWTYQDELNSLDRNIAHNLYEGNYDCYDFVKENKEVLLSLYSEPRKVRKKEEFYDYINPSHYTDGGKEVIDMMLDIWGAEKLIIYCEITAFKYRMRLGKKPEQPIERDFEKACWYENKAKELRELI